MRQPTVKVSIHSSSALRRKGHKFLVAFDILEVDGRVSARLCQAVNPEWITQVAPQVLIREDGRQMWGYNPKTGEVVLNGVGIEADF